MQKPFHRLFNAAKRIMRRTGDNLRVREMAIQVARNAPQAATNPILFFNASTRLSGLSLNAAYALLASWGLRLSGSPVHHFVCQSGMTRCIHGTNREKPDQPPPCRECIHQSGVNYQSAGVTWFTYQQDRDLETQISELSVSEMMAFSWKDVPLGSLVLPSLRWVLRRYHLQDDADTRFFFRQYILSAWSVAVAFEDVLQRIHPLVVVVFNGMVYPEAVARWLAQRKGIRVITHEVNLLPFTAYFTEREATFRTVDINPQVELAPWQAEKLDAYLEKRFQGKFNMAGVTFWKEMRDLDEKFENTIAHFKQVVPVFTNVIFDTTQDHANTVFAHMFDWLDTIYRIIQAHPETLFIIRAHPDEWRPGKSSLESVADWIKTKGAERLENLLFIPPDEYVSSYALIQRAKFTLVYTSTIGLEATLMGAPVLAGGKARFHHPQAPTVYFENTPSAFIARVETFLEAEAVRLPEEYLRNARKYLYAELYQYALPFDEFVEDDKIWNGYVRLKRFSWRHLLPEHSRTMRVLVDGILKGRPFRME